MGGFGGMGWEQNSVAGVEEVRSLRRGRRQREWH
jgi:hypothetical protein